jgi:predicted porin
MAEAAGVDGADRGLVSAGARFQLTEHYAIGGVNHYVDDIINIAFAATDYTRALTDEIGLRLESQFSHQASVGKDLLTEDDFDTWNLGARASVSAHNLILKTAFSATDDGDRIRSPYGAYPGYISLMQKDFNRADEDAWLVGASYDFKDWGLDGLSMFANYAEGSGARDADGASSSDQREFNVTADYKVKKGPARGAWLRVRWSTLDVEGMDDESTDFRVIVNYELPVF